MKNEPFIEQGDCPEVLIAFLLIGLSSFFFGLGLGWLIWG